MLAFRGQVLSGGSVTVGVCFLADMTVSTFLSRLKKTKVVQWAIAYMAIVWASVGVLTLVTDLASMPAEWLAAAGGVVVGGLLATVVIAWLFPAAEIKGLGDPALAQARGAEPSLPAPPRMPAGVRVEVLGGLRVWRSGVELGSLSGKPLPCSLLVYVALERTTTRDAVMALLWPESDVDTARHRLSETLYRLRQQLGDEWLATPGDMLEATDALQSDVQDLEGAVAAGRWSDVFDGYDGELLQGVHLARTHEFQQWADRVQARVRQLQQKAHAALVEERYAAGDVAGALAAVRARVQRDPLDEKAQHRLIRLLAEMGRRTDALRQYGRFAKVLQDELEVEPPEETRALVERIRTGEVDGLELGLPGQPVPAEEMWGGTERPRPGRRMVTVPLATLLVAGTAALMVGAIFWLATRPAGTPPDPNKIVGFPLADRASETSDTTGVSLILGNALERAQPLKWIDGWHWLSEAQRRDAITLTPRDARRIALELGAGKFMTGATVRAGDSFSVVLQLHDAIGDSLVQQSTATGSATNVSSVAVHALLGVLPAMQDPGRAVDLRYLTDRDPAALATWIQGEKQYRRARFEDALAYYQHALEIDSLLAPAAFKGAEAASWSHDPEEAQRLLVLAARHDTLMSPRQRALSRGLVAYYAGDADSAVALLRHTLTIDPTWGEAWAALGEVYHHLIPSDVQPPESEEDAFRNALRHDPEFRPALVHLAEASLRGGEVARADSLIGRLRGELTDSVTLRELEIASDCVRDAPPPGHWRSTAQRDGLATLYAGYALNGAGAQLGCGIDLVRAALEYGNLDRATRGSAISALAGALTAAGRSGEAMTMLDTLLANGDMAAGFPIILEAAAGARADSEAAGLDSYMRQRLGPGYAGIDAVTAWALGTWHAGRGDSEALRLLHRRAVESLQRLRQSASPRPDRLRRERMLAEALAADLALLNDTPDTAIRRFRALRTSASSRQLTWQPDEALAVERMTLARLLLRTRQYQEAHDVAAVFDHPAPISFLYFLPESLGIRYAAARALGRRRQAEAYEERLRKIGRQDLLNPQSTAPLAWRR